jgi:hypothetical protein
MAWISFYGLLRSGADGEDGLVGEATLLGELHDSGGGQPFRCCAQLPLLLPKVPCARGKHVLRKVNELIAQSFELNIPSLLSHHLFEAELGPLFILPFSLRYSPPPIKLPPGRNL